MGEYSYSLVTCAARYGLAHLELVSSLYIPFSAFCFNSVAVCLVLLFVEGYSGALRPSSLLISFIDFSCSHLFCVIRINFYRLLPSIPHSFRTIFPMAL